MAEQPTPDAPLCRETIPPVLSSPTLTAPRSLAEHECRVFASMCQRLHQAQLLEVRPAWAFVVVALGGPRAQPFVGPARHWKFKASHRPWTGRPGAMSGPGSEEGDG